MSVFRKAAVYLGLVDDEDEEVYEYEDYGDDGAEPAVERAVPRTPAARPPEGNGSVRVVQPMRLDTGTEAVRTIGGVGAVRAVAPSKVYVLEPRGFNDAQEVGDRLKQGQPVILNLQGLDRDLQRRLIDFSSGLCYALTGTMAKAADHVFLLTPPNVEVSDDEKERLRDRGLYRH